MHNFLKIYILWKKVWIQNRWLLMKPVDLDLHCFSSMWRIHISCEIAQLVWLKIRSTYTVKSRLSEHRLYETTGLFEDDGQSRLFPLLFIAIKLPIIRISIIWKIQFFEVIRRSRLKNLLLNYPSRFEVQMSRIVVMITLFGRVWLTHPSDLGNKVATGNWHRINVHTITWGTIKWVNGVFH